MRKRSLIAVAGLSVAALALTACGSSSDDAGGSESPSGGKVGVILPDAQTSAALGEQRPALAGRRRSRRPESSQTSRTPMADKTKFGTICDSMIARASTCS